MNEPKRKAPRMVRGAVVSLRLALGRLGLDNLGLGLAIADRDLARLFRRRDFAHEIDVQQSVLEARALDLHMVGKLEDALEGASGNALIEHFAVLFFLSLLGALDRQGVFFRFDREFVLAEAGNRDSDAVIVLTSPLDVVGRVAWSGLESIEHGKEPIEADG